MSERLTSRLKTIKQVAHQLGISEQTVNRLRRRNELSAIRIGRRVLFDENEIARFLERASARQ
jgi:excisionase family DNA binding protein